MVDSSYSNATQEQISLLQTTAVPLRSLTFAPCDPASCVVLQQPVRGWSDDVCTFGGIGSTTYAIWFPVRHAQCICAQTLAVCHSHGSPTQYACHLMLLVTDA